MHKKFYCGHWFLKNEIVSLFLIVKMNANYAEICRVGNLEADFQPSPLIHFFWNFQTSKIKIQRRKIKNIFLDKTSQKSLYYRNCIGQTIFFGRKFNFTVNIWEQNTETEKTNCFW